LSTPHSAERIKTLGKRGKDPPSKDIREKSDGKGREFKEKELEGKKSQLAERGKGS